MCVRKPTGLRTFWSRPVAPWFVGNFQLMCLLCFCMVETANSALSAAELTLQIAPIHANVTPQPGDVACVGFMPKISSIEHPLELKGLLIRTGNDSGAETFVIAALDYNGLCNTSDDLWRSRIAEAVGTTPDRVALQSLHQHTAPVLDLDGAKLLYAGEPEKWKAHAAFSENMANRAAKAAHEAQTKLQPVTRMIASQAKADRVASNRRIVQPDGTIVFRGSGVKDPVLHEAPEGLIDPWVRTLTFLNDKTIIAQVHYYATHPQSFYGDERITYDVPGIARQRLQDETGVYQIYFTGCGGNIAMGKYNDATRAARDILSERLYQAMKASVAVVDAGADAMAKPTSPDDPQVVQDVRIHKLSKSDISWMVIPARFTPRDDGEFHPERARDLMRPEQSFSTRLKASMAVAWFDRLRAGHQVGISRLRIGSVQMIHLPGEPFVEFQLSAQQHAAKSFVCVAGYGECGIWYYGPDVIFADRGGYEQTWSFAEPCYDLVDAAIKKLVSSDK